MAREQASFIVVVLAAGQGTRMRSRTIKLLHPVAGRPMIGWVLDAVEALRPARVFTVVGHQGERLREALAGHATEFVEQREQRGTGHALMQVAPRLRRTRGTLLILNGDLPLIRPATLRAVTARHRRAGAALTLATAEVRDPSGYGRIVRDGRGRIARIVEHRDASRTERAIREINCGLYCAQARPLLETLRSLRPSNAQGEYYLTDAVHRLIRAGQRVEAVLQDDPAELGGVNTRAELSEASRALYRRKANELMERGVTLLDAGRIWIDPRARIGRDTVVWPDVVIEGATVLGEGCTVRPGCRIADSRGGRGVEFRDHCVVVSSRVDDGAQVGPFAHLRPGSWLGSGSRVGNFVELKQTRLGRGSKASHLTYLGDATIGDDCNIGAGTITCNYDGERKHRSVLDDRVFVGSDTQLVAPVHVHEGAYVAAGTTVTEDVPAGALAIGRSRQRNVRDWVARRRRKPR